MHAFLSFLRTWGRKRDARHDPLHAPSQAEMP